MGVTGTPVTVSRTVPAAADNVVMVGVVAALVAGLMSPVTEQLSA